MTEQAIASPLTEKLVLSCALHGGPEMAGQILSETTEQDFSLPEARAARSLAAELYGRGEALSVSVLERSAQVSGDVDVQLFLSDLAWELPDLQQADVYLRDLRSLRIRRDLGHAALDIGGLARCREDGELALAEAITRLRQIEPERREERTMAQVIEERIANLDTPLTTGLSTGLPGLDRQLQGLRPGQLVVVAGRPGMGKSAFGLGIARDVAYQQLRGAYLVSLEMSREEIADRILSAETGVEFRKVRGRTLNATERHRLAERAAEIKGLDLWVEDEFSSEVERIGTQAHRKASDYGLDLLVVDYLQLLTTAKGSDSRAQEISTITRFLKRLAVEVGCCVVALSQLNRRTDQRENKRPVLAELKDSGSIEQDADVVLFLYRPGYYQQDGNRKAEIIVAKNRDGATGILDAVADLEHMRFYQEEEYR